jgi:enterochelin esterase family protein
VPPSLTRLAAAIENVSEFTRVAVLQRFWVHVETAGAPLVEPAGPGRSWVTFLWRAGVDDVGLPPPIRPVMVMGGPALWWQIPDNVLDPLRGTDVLFRTYLVDDDLRGRYILSPGDPLTSLPRAGTPESVERSARFRPDPRNPTPLTLGADPADPLAETATYSTFALPAATQRHWVERRHGVASGTVTHHRFTSAVLGNSRSVWIYRPAGELDPAGTLVMLDGRDWIEWVPLATTLDNLIADREIPPVTVILPEACDTATRYRELTVNPDHTKFLVDEILPWASELIPIDRDPRRIAVHGKSFGGLAALSAAWSRPDAFGTVLSQSGSFWFTGWDGGTDEVLTDAVGSAPRRGAESPIRVSLDIGSLEGEAMLDSHRRMATVLRERGYPLREHEYHGGHDINCWISELLDALRWWTDPL